MDSIYVYNEDSEQIDHFTQWDHGQKIIFDCDYDDTVRVDFCNSKSDTAYRVSTTLLSDGRYEADVPNLLLQTALPIYAFIFISGDDSGRVVACANVPVRARTQPNDYDYKENVEIVSVLALQEELEEWIAKCETATENAETATDDAESAASTANTAASAANTAASSANSAATKATSAASSANTAADRANAAAEEAEAVASADISTMTVTFDESVSGTDITSGESLGTTLAKIQTILTAITNEEIDNAFN